MNTARWNFNTAPFTGPPVGINGVLPPPTGLVTHHAIASGPSGSAAATVVIQGTLDPTGQTGWQTIVTLNPTSATVNPNTGLSEAIDSLVAQHTWPVQRAQITSITGTGTNVAVFTSAAQ